MSDGYSDEEVEEILRRALSNRTEGLRREELVQAATEAGISAEAVESAIDELHSDRGSVRLHDRVRRSRRRRLSHRFVSLGIINGFLFAVDWLTGGGWWIQWLLLGSAFVVTWDARRAYFPSDEDLDRAVKRLSRREQREHRRQLERHARRDRAHVHAEFELAVERGVAALLGAISKRIDPAALQRGRPPDSDQGR